MRPPQPRTIVVYIYSNTDPEYERNLRFFVEHGVRAGSECHYVIVVQQARGYCRVMAVVCVQN